MKRRGITVIVGALLVAALTALVLQAPVPYVEFVPGPTYNTLGLDSNGKDVLTITGTSTSHSTGQLRFVTIGVVKDLSLLEALRGWWQHDDAVLPREFVIPPGKTETQVNQESAQQFTDSQSAAETAALTRLGYPSRVEVGEVTKGAPADGVLRTADVIVRVDGTAIAFADKLVALVRGKPVGATLTLDILRNGTPQQVKIITAKGADGKSRIGVEPKQTQPHPFTITVPVSNVGGPSAGLMLALGITDKLDPTDLTGGKIIAGTGEIDETGAVLPIGGIQQKLPAAKRDGATIFLVPAVNCAEAVASTPGGLTLVKVGSLAEALTALSQLRAGTQPTLCPGAH